MKKIFALSLAFITVISLAACSGNGGAASPATMEVQATSAKPTGAAPSANHTATLPAEIGKANGGRLTIGGFSIVTPTGWSNVEKSGGCTLLRASDGASISVETVEGGERDAVAAEKLLLYNFNRSQYYNLGAYFFEGKITLAGEEALAYECFLSSKVTGSTPFYWAYYFLGHADTVYCFTVYSGSRDLTGDGEILSIINSVEFT